MTEPFMQEAEDFRAEVQTLYAVLAGADPAVWEEPTAFKHYKTFDVIAHLHAFDKAAAESLKGPEAFLAYTRDFNAANARGDDWTVFTRAWVGIDNGPELLEAWRTYADTLADAFRTVDPKARVPWGRGPGMSARSSISARQMETWSHGQAVFDLMGVDRADGDRIRNIVVLGVNTYGFTFRNRGLPVPEPAPHVRLTAPSGAIWTFNDEGSDSRIEGTATEFCQVAAQTRNIADTGLTATGPAALAWAPIAQCFAGAPNDPPPPGLRVKRPPR